MLRSSTCNLYIVLHKKELNLEKGIEDPGGYFIINGNERVLIGHYVMLIIEVFVLENKFSEPLTCDMRSMSE